MSIYIPKLETLRVTLRKDGWWIDDDHGSYDGPYPTATGCYATIESWYKAEQEDED